MPVAAKARPPFLGGRAALLRLHPMVNAMKVQIAVQVGKGFKASLSVVIPISVVLTVLALLV